MAKIIIPENLEGKEIYAWLVKNKKLHYAEKKAELKKADAVSCLYVTRKGEIVKAMSPDEVDEDVMERSLVINTTNIMDSHSDVHINGLWKKSLQEEGYLLLCQEHEMTFDHVISDEVDAYTKIMSWKALGWDVPGSTEALIFDATIHKDRNDYMFGQYKKGYVRNHSVGMRYVKLELAVNDEDYKEEFAVWNKYIDRIANRDDVESQGYFWAITEAKVVEGSAVVKGSNWMTPDITDTKSNTRTRKTQPALTTGEDEPLPFDVMAAINKANIII